MTDSLLTLQGEAYDNFVNTIKSDATKKQYIKAVVKYMQFLEVSNLEELQKGDTKLLQARIISFIMSHRERGLSTSLIQLRLAALKHFYAVNDLVLNWDKIYSFIGQPTKKHKNRPYTREEISKILSVSMQRDRVIILLLASTGMRVGALTSIQMKHLKRIQRFNLYQITVYDSENGEYDTFSTPECSKEIDEYLDYRRKAGEKISPESYLLREYFDINDNEQVTRPKQLKTNSIQFQIHQKLIHAGIRDGHLLESEKRGSKRYEVRMSHGFRKFYYTSTNLAGMKLEHTKLLTGQSIGVSSFYLLPKMSELLEGNDKVKGYIDAINDLTINDENRLHMKVKELQSEKDILINTLQKRMANIEKALLNKSPDEFQNLLDLEIQTDHRLSFEAILKARKKLVDMAANEPEQFADPTELAPEDLQVP